MRIGLGTAQFGMDYGITNKVGQVPEWEVANILDAAEAAGITILDTAHAYGTSEEVLGKFDAGYRFKVVTKAPKGCTADELRDAFHASLSRLGRVYGLLLHDTADIYLWPVLEELRDDGNVEKIGISVYDEIPDLPIDIIQVPFNPLDRRLLDNGTLEQLHRDGVEIHARSIFLQGLLLTEEYPAHLMPLEWAVDQMRRGMNRMEWTLGTVLQCPYIDTFLCGVTSLEELTEIVKAANNVVAMEPPEFVPQFASRYLNPAKWPELV